MTTTHQPLHLVNLHPRPIDGLEGKAAVIEAGRELTAMMYRYLRATDRMRTARTARYVSR
jgi:hypothetical protein